MRLLRILAAAATVMFAAALPPAALPAFAEPVVLHRGNGAEPDTLDPQKATGQWENNIIGDLFMGLMTEDPDGHPVYGMAESYEISEDGKTWTFKLRPDATWSDGVPVTADDFVFALQRLNSPETMSQYASMSQDVIVNALEVLKGEVRPDQIGARAIDAKTLELKLRHPASYLPSLLMHYSFYPVPKHAVQKFGSDWTKPGNFVSNGAYTLVEWRPNEFVHAKKNPKFFDAANVKIDEVYYYSQEDLIANVKRFRAGEFDISQGIPGQLLDELRRSMPESVHIAPYIANWYITFNLTRDPWKDVRIRTALGLAIDREKITDVILRGGETPAYTFVQPNVPNYPHTAKLRYADMKMPERLAEARRLLAEAGYGPGNPLTFEFMHMQATDSKRTAAALQSMWKAIGVDMRPAGSETKIVYANLRSQNFEVALAGWIADFPDASSYLYLAKTAADEMNYSKYSNAEYDQLNIDGDNEPDATKRGEILSRAEQIMLDDAPMVPIYNAVTRNLVRPYVSGWADALTNNHRTRWMTIDQGARVQAKAEKAKGERSASAEAGDTGGERPWYWWLVAAWEWLTGLLCAWFGVACPAA
ncbi:MAG: peptide ABC transporter substrate-binding protein [Alphaproteobacteria bacterium]|nr:peptide ABC transporter substrate-binding protein [Alphaproteobacteria bacterium]